MKIPVSRLGSMGNSLIEYTLIGGLVVIGCIVSFSFFGDNLGQWFSAFKDDLGTSKKSAAAYSIPAGSGTVSGTVAVTGTPTGGSGVTLNGSTISLPQYPADLSKSIQTAGANGTSELLLGSMETAIKQLLANNQITQAEADKLTKLANVGHQLAAVEKQLEGAFATSNGDVATFAKMRLTFQGDDTQTPHELAQQLQLDQDTGFTASFDDSLIAQYQTLQKESVMQLANPEAKQIVGALSNQIVAIADSLEGAINEYQAKTLTAKAFYSDLAHVISEVDPSNGKLPTSLPSGMTNQSSAKICTVGSGTDSGTQCQ